MAERNDMTAALVTAYTSPQLAAINEYMGAEKAVRAAAETLGLDADLMIAEAEGLARATTFSNVEALYFVADQATSGKREVNGHDHSGNDRPSAGYCERRPRRWP